MSTLVGHIQDLVKRDKMEQALRELEIWAAKNDDDLHNTVIIQTSRLNQLKRNERMGILSRDEAYRTGNQIRFAVLSILEDLPKDVEISSGVSSGATGTQTSDPVATPKPAVRKLFISYAREDRAYVEGLERHLGSLIRSGHIDSWTDSQILPGQDWKKEIKDRLEEANIILYMVSSDFLSSDFINDNERVWAEQKRAAKGALIVPVIVRHCDWGDQDFARYNAIPRHKTSTDLVPISRWEDKDEAYLTVVKGLKSILDNM